VVAQVAAGDTPRLYAFTGDTANARDGIRHDIPKPWLYSTFVIPEDTERLSEVRRLLRTLERDQKATLLVPHDEHSIEDTDVLRWTGP